MYLSAPCSSFFQSRQIFVLTRPCIFPLPIPLASSPGRFFLTPYVSFRSLFLLLPIQADFCSNPPMYLSASYFSCFQSRQIFVLTRLCIFPLPIPLAPSPGSFFFFFFFSNPVCIFPLLIPLAPSPGRVFFVFFFLTRLCIFPLPIPLASNPGRFLF